MLLFIPLVITLGHPFATFIDVGSGLEGGVGDRIRCLCTSVVDLRSCLPFLDLLLSPIFPVFPLNPSRYLTAATSSACPVEMQPSQFEIQHEVENSRDVRRRTSAGGPGALVPDPDLPNQSALATAAQLNYWDPSQTASGSSSSTEESDSSANDHDDASDGGDPSSLFQVPARLHLSVHQGACQFSGQRFNSP